MSLSRSDQETLPHLQWIFFVELVVSARMAALQQRLYFPCQGELWPSEEMMGQYCSSFSKPRNGRRQASVALTFCSDREGTTHVTFIMIRYLLKILDEDFIQKSKTIQGRLQQ